MLADMDNMYQPPGGGPHDNWPTQDLGPAGGQPPRPSGTRRPWRWSAGIALAALLAGGGAVAAAALTSSPASATAQPSGQAAALNTILSSASSPGAGSAAGTASASSASANSGSASSPGTAAPAATADAAALSPTGTATPATALGRCRQAAQALRTAGRRRAAGLVRRACASRLVRIRGLGGMHGEFTFKTKSGVRTIAFSRGVIQSVAGGNLVVRSADNSIWTWDLVSSTVVRQQGKKVGNSALSSGEQVFAGGPVVSGANDARLIVIRPASAKSAS
jgi:hypothetical protein